MQYHIQTLVKHLFDKDSFEQVTAQELQQFTDEYPYAAVGQFLYAKKLKDSGSYNHYEQSETSSLYFNNPLWLRYILDKKEEAPALPERRNEQVQQPGFRIHQTHGTDTPEEKKEEPVILSGVEGLSGVEVSDETKQAEALNVTQGPAEIEAFETMPAVSGVEELTDPDGSREEAMVAEETSPSYKEETITEAETTPSTEAVSAVEAQDKQEETTPVEPEVASTVAIAEISQLAEESKAEPALNAVSITEEALTAPVAVAEEVATLPAAVEESIQPLAAIEAQTVTQQQEAAATAPPADATSAINSESVTNVTETPAKEEEKVQQPVHEQAAVAQPVVFTPASQEAKTAVDLGEPIFESYHTIDYFASQGIKLQQEDFKDRLGKQLKSFTDWLRSMKRIGPMETSTSLDEITNQSIQRIAEHSVEGKEVVTEAMAEVWAKQGHTDKAIRVYEKLSLLDPAKSPYFAGRIEQLKAL